MQKLGEMEMIVRQMTFEELEKYKMKGPFSEYPHFMWEFNILQHKKYENIYKMNLKISGIKGKRSINLSKWIILRFPEDEEKETVD